MDMNEATCYLYIYPPDIFVCKDCALRLARRFTFPERHFCMRNVAVSRLTLPSLIIALEINF